MPISEPEWNSIRTFVERICAQVSGRRSEFFETGTVSKRDEVNRLIWLKGFSDDPIPIVDFEHEVKYYDTDADGNVAVKKAKVTTVVPKVGQTVLVAYEMGTSRLPRCLGVVQGKNWIVTED
jgi:hypothetical protein